MSLNAHPGGSMRCIDVFSHLPTPRIATISPCPRYNIWDPLGIKLAILVNDLCPQLLLFLYLRAVNYECEEYLKQPRGTNHSIYRLAIEKRLMAIYPNPKEEHNVFVLVFKCSRILICPLYRCIVISSF